MLQMYIAWLNFILPVILLFALGSPSMDSWHSCLGYKGQEWPLFENALRALTFRAGDGSLHPAPRFIRQPAQSAFH